MRIGIYTFYKSSCQDMKFKEYADAINYVMDSEKPIKYTFGLSFRNPTTHNKPITKEEALKLLLEDSMTDIDEFEDYIHINQYHINDMW